MTRSLAGAEDGLHALEKGPPSRLADLAASECPRTTGVYTLWDEELFLYVGVARINPAETANPQADGVRGRLNTYRRARLTSEFAIGMLLRFIIPQLSAAERDALGRGAIGMSEMTARLRTHLDRHVTFRAWSCDAATALALETHIRRRGLETAPTPVFNPL